MPRHAVLAAALTLVFAAGCGGSDQSLSPPAGSTPGSVSDAVPATLPTEAPASRDGLPGTYVPTSMAPVDPTALPPALRSVDAMAGGDPAEAECIRHGIAASLEPGEDPPEARPGVAGTAVVACLPPAKLAATLTERLRGPALGLNLSAGDLACIRAELATSGSAPEFTMLVGGLALGDVAAVRAGAAALDRRCGTTLATP